MPSPSPEASRLAFVGGTGPEGQGLAMRLARTGHPVMLGSRTPPLAQSVAEALRERVGGSITGRANAEAAELADIVFLTIPHSGVSATLPGLSEVTRGKIVVSAIAPVRFEEGKLVSTRPPHASVAEEVRDLLPDSRVVSGFQSVDAHSLQDLESELDSDVIVCSDDAEARHVVVALANEIQGLRGLSGGRLVTSRHVEEITALLITVNRIYKVHSGFRVTGVKR